jgi:hypothetical protein
LLAVPTLRYLLGTARLRTSGAARDVRGRLQRRPTAASAVPRPRRPRDRERLQLTHALIATDLNPRYLDFWPLVRRAWAGVAELEPRLVLIADDADIPRPLREDPLVDAFAPVAGIHTAFQAQCIRLLYPALLDTDGGVVISDADMVPLSRRYFHRPAAQIASDQFVAYRDTYLQNGEIPMCYNAALPGTWGEIFGVDGLDDVRRRLTQWAEAVEYSGLHGGTGWLTDQRILYRTLLEWGARTARVWILDDFYTRYRRLERASLRKRGELDERNRRLIERGAYSDFHCIVPYDQFRELNELTVDLAIDAAGTSGDATPAPRERSPGWLGPRA